MVFCPGALRELFAEEAALLLPDLLTFEDLAPGFIYFRAGGAAVGFDEVVEALLVLRPVESAVGF